MSAQVETCGHSVTVWSDHEKRRPYGAGTVVSCRSVHRLKPVAIDLCHSVAVRCCQRAICHAAAKGFDAGVSATKWRSQVAAGFNPRPLQYRVMFQPRRGDVRDGNVAPAGLARLFRVVRSTG
jgi:hypothetical protein